MTTPLQTLFWVGPGQEARGLPGAVDLLEQTLLPLREERLIVRDVPGMVDAIWRLAVRGAPAIGVAAAYGMVLGIQHLAEVGATLRADQVLAAARATKATLDAARPTAVNLAWATTRVLARLEAEAARGAAGAALVRECLDEAHRVYDEDRASCRAMGEHGAALIADGATLLTHCNAGALATAGLGTALAPIYVAAEQGKRVAVFADETRPLLQGARITAFELMRAGIDVTLITDGMAARVMGEGRIDAVFVGSDRIARNGDVCNKIGTYGVALAAAAHGVPFYVVAPLSTIDPSLDDGSGIPIEERPATEVTEGFGTRTAPLGVKVYAPAFDVTPRHLIAAIVTEVGLIERPDTAGVEAALRRGGVTW
ncbi:MAG: S-methyl-5-thioribose-1-phosphate isomerase [Planctomycetota bacterium]